VVSSFNDETLAEAHQASDYSLVVTDAVSGGAILVEGHQDVVSGFAWVGDGLLITSCRDGFLRRIGIPSGELESIALKSDGLLLGPVVSSSGTVAFVREVYGNMSRVHVVEL
jgi:hypothetical protein